MKMVLTLLTLVFNSLSCATGVLTEETFCGFPVSVFDDEKFYVPPTSAFDDETFCVRADDKPLCGPSDEELSLKKGTACYGKGAVWMRPCTTRIGIDLYYRPEDAEPLPSGLHPCYRCYFSHDKKLWIKPLKALFETLRPFFYSDYDFFFEYAAKFYKMPAQDILCAAVTGIKESFSGRCPYSGVEHPHFQSWARHIPWGKNPPSGRMLDSSGHPDGRGDLWVRREKSGRCVLCYRAEYGPPWIYYLYGLEQEEGWSKRWLPALREVKKFAFSDKLSFDEDSCANASRLVAGLKVTLAGKAGCFLGSDPVVWKPIRSASQVLQHRDQDQVLAGAVLCGTYQKGTAWVFSMPEKYVLRIRTDDDEVFQFQYSRVECGKNTPSTHMGLIAQSIDLILGSDDSGAS